MTDRYAVIGNPVAHSRSPEIHAAFARECGADIEYGRLLAPVARFAETAEAFRAGGAAGANVTLPFKLEAFAFAHARTARAERGRSVNTLHFETNHVVGDNTDGVGLCRDIEQNIGQPLLGTRILLIGAGGAARAVVGALMDCQPELLAITNRTPAKAQAIVDEINVKNMLRAVGLTELPKLRFDVLINATSASLSASLPLVPLSSFDNNALAYDMMYGKGLTPFLALAAGTGARTADGIGMLVEQAAEAFYVWRGVRPSTGPVLDLLKQAAR
ncbi:MAG: shikimate dehydrogenase [Burkholderiales bacterium]|nr:shikimate dehydrogenase [Burkholderiales bacterium]